jgi:hypothetical protein
MTTTRARAYELPEATDTLPKKTTEAKAAYQPPDTEHASDRHDKDGDAAAKGDGLTGMHTSLANAYWKALNSAQPILGPSLCTCCWRATNCLLWNCVVT